MASATATLFAAMQAAVLLKLLWPPPLRLRALLAMHGALDTHSCMPHLFSTIHSPQFTAHLRRPQPATSDAPPPDGVPATGAEEAAADNRGANGCKDPVAAVAMPEAEAAMVGHSVGWARIGLPWWRLDRVQVRVTLDLGAADDVAQLQRLCAFHSVSAGGRRCGGVPNGELDSCGPCFFVAAAVGGVAVPPQELRGLLCARHVCYPAIHALHTVNPYAAAEAAIDAVAVPYLDLASPKRWFASSKGHQNHQTRPSCNAGCL